MSREGALWIGGVRIIYLTFICSSRSFLLDKNLNLSKKPSTQTTQLWLQETDFGRLYLMRFLPIAYMFTYVIFDLLQKRSNVQFLRNFDVIPYGSRLCLNDVFINQKQAGTSSSLCTFYSRSKFQGYLLANSSWGQCYKTFIIRNLRNKLECLYLASFSSLG